MRKTLLTTAAVAVVSLAVGFGGIAAAQSQMGNESGKGTSGAASGAAAPGSMQQKGAGPSGGSLGDKTMNPSGPAQSSERNSKKNEQFGQSPNDQQKGMTRGAQEEKRGTGPKGTEERGAQEERGVKERGAQEEQGKTGAGGSERLGQSRGSGKPSVQLSQDQRSRIQAAIGKEHAPRFSGNEHFDIAVGARVPRDVHVAVLPEDIVSIVPEYRGFDYVLVGDSILIIDPSTLEIVAVIPA